VAVSQILIWPSVQNDASSSALYDSRSAAIGPVRPALPLPKLSVRTCVRVYVWAVEGDTTVVRDARVEPLRRVDVLNPVHQVLGQRFGQLGWKVAHQGGHL
jgi:hypothetical protein